VGATKTANLCDRSSGCGNIGANMLQPICTQEDSRRGARRACVRLRPGIRSISRPSSERPGTSPDVLFCLEFERRRAQGAGGSETAARAKSLDNDDKQLRSARELSALFNASGSTEQARSYFRLVQAQAARYAAPRRSSGVGGGWWQRGEQDRIPVNAATEKETSYGVAIMNQAPDHHAANRRMSSAGWSVSKPSWAE